MLSALKNFFITFLIAALIFGSAAYFATKFLTNTITGIFAAESSELEGILTPENSGNPSPSDTSVPDNPSVNDDPDASIQGDSFNMLFIVTDYQSDMFDDYFPDQDTLKEQLEAGETGEFGLLGKEYRYPRAVATVLLRADKERKEFTYTVFPAITRVNTPTGDHTLGDLYNLYGKNYIVDQVAAMTGLTIDFHLHVNVTELYDIVFEMGGFPLYLKEELYYDGRVSTSQRPEDGFTEPFYTIGSNTIDGAGSIALMMWEDYSSAAALADRNDLLVDILSAILTKVTALPQAEFTAFYDKIYESGWIDSNFTTKDLVSRMELICAISSDTFTVKTLDYPGRYISATETENAWFSPSTASGIVMFKSYRKVIGTNNS